MAGAPPINTGSDRRTVATDQRPGPADVFRSLGSYKIYDEARERHMTLSALLERDHPQSNYNDGLDAFARVFAQANIVTRSDPQGGYMADEMDAFDRDENTRALFPEWGWRQWRKASSQAREVILSSSGAVGSLERPYADAGAPRRTQLAPAIPLDEVVAFTTTIDADNYRAFYLTHDAAQARLVRVAEGAELPRASIVGAERSNVLPKYGRLLEVTYEQVRRRRIDKVAFWIQSLSVQTEIDKVAHTLEVAVNGDGNSGTAATNHNLLTLDPAAQSGTVSLTGWLNFKLQFTNPYALTHVFARSAEALQLYLLNVGSANVPLVTIQAASNLGGLVPINRELGDNVRIGITSDAPANVIVGMDARFAIEQVIEAGSIINDQQQWIHRQVNALSFSENMTFVTADNRAVRTLTLNA
jgi:hypothetical protein